MSRAKPASERLGNPSKKKAREDKTAPHLAVVEDVEVPVPPPYLSAGPELELWEAAWRAGGSHYDPVLHFEIVAQFCELTSELDEMRAALFDKEKGKRKFLSRGSQDQVIQHPLRKDFKEVRVEYVRLMKELGKTPEASVRLNMAAHQFKSAMDAVRGSAEVVEVVDVDEV